MKNMLSLLVFFSLLGTTTQVMAQGFEDDPSDAPCYFDCKKEKPKYFWDTKPKKDDKLIDRKPQSATEPLEPWGKKKHRSLGDIQRDQFKTR